MATVAAPTSGATRTDPLDSSREAAHRVAMLAHRISERFAAWLLVENRVDRWASYGALGIATVAIAIVAIV